ncbi:hypothetical protein ABVT39_014375 [Epinephelus coioides]
MARLVLYARCLRIVSAARTLWRQSVKWPCRPGGRRISLSMRLGQMVKLYAPLLELDPILDIQSDVN